MNDSNFPGMVDPLLVADIEDMAAPHEDDFTLIDEIKGLYKGLDNEELTDEVMSGRLVSEDDVIQAFIAVFCQGVNVRVVRPRTEDGGAQ